MGAAGVLLRLGNRRNALASGCRTTTEPRTPPADPLYGERPPEKPYGVAGPTPPPQNRSAKRRQFTVGYCESNSNAALLIPDPLIGAQSLGFNDPSHPPPPPSPSYSPSGSTWQTNDLSTASTGGAGTPIVKLRTPEQQGTQPIQPVPPPVIVPPTGPISVNPAPTFNTPAPTLNTVGYSDYDQLQNALKARGVISQEQKTLADGVVHFSCRVPNPIDPTFIRVYEATAPNYRSAIIAVLEQIDQRR